MTAKRFAKITIKLWDAKQVLKRTLPQLQKLHQKNNVESAVWNPIVNRHNAAMAEHRAALRDLAAL